MDSPDRNRIEKMERGLYSRKHPAELKTERSSISPGQFDVNDSWGKGDDDLQELLRKEQERGVEKQGTFFKKIFIGSAIFFVLAIGVATFLFLGGANFVSGNNIDIEVQGPTTIGGGEELSLDFIIKNNNNTDLQNANLTVNYPTGTRVAGDLNTELDRQTEAINTIPAKGQVTETLNSVLFGQKDSVQELNLTLEYQVKGSSAVFTKQKTFDISIGSSPVVVTVQNPQQVNSNQQVAFDVTVASNSSTVLKDLLLHVDYPFGFTFQSASPQPFSSNNVWQLGDLGVGGKQTIHIVGTLQGQDNEDRTFQFSTGIADPNKSDTIAATFVVVPETVTIEKPFIGLDVNVGGDSGTNHIASPGDKIQTNISLTNNLPSQLLDTQVTAVLSGAALDQSSVSVSDGGFYSSSNNTIIWDKSSTPELQSLDPGANQVLNFIFSPLTSFDAGASNQEINLAVTVTGNQVVDNGTPQAVSTTINSTVQLASVVNLGTRLVRTVGPFTNTGPVPPIANTPTTYTVTWSLTNSLNTISQTQVSAQLPPYITWLGMTDPSLESLSFDPTTNIVSWNVGDLQSETGYSTTPREASFQISFTPSITQVGNSPTLVQGSTLTGTDRFTNASITASAPALTTRFASDPAFRTGDDIVGK